MITSTAHRAASEASSARAAVPAAVIAEAACSGGTSWVWFGAGSSRVAPSTAGSRQATGSSPPWEPQYLNDVHDLRVLNDPRGVFPPPDQSWVTANRAAFARLPETTRAVLGRIRLTLANVTAMDRAVNLDGLDPLAATRAWIDQHHDASRRGAADEERRWPRSSRARRIAAL
jgi:Substrate binding domain of ABC-type glycine betaine transport system